MADRISTPTEGIHQIPKMEKFQRPFGFGLRAFKKFPELIPLAAIISTACLGAASFVGYALVTKPDVRVNKSSELPPWERVKPTEPRKMRVVNKDVYKPIPELEQLRREIGSYKS
ncbi:normal mucosa of esophagus-specific gene 1 protein-like [Babylonia areolata]|uniref:normal mucosa of esophagus-specific gene 1 protein-like n=1 Tax=Babylonia areolata TaxID=304850 RepID=UPI003FD0652A